MPYVPTFIFVFPCFLFLGGPLFLDELVLPCDHLQEDEAPADLLLLTPRLADLAIKQLPHIEWQGLLPGTLQRNELKLCIVGGGV